MKNRNNRPPEGQPWVWITRELLSSDAWRSMSINGRRLLDFLLLEHMRHGGQKNGGLLAPRRQLVEFGIGSHFISAAINELDRLGLIDCRRGHQRVPSVYALTWLPRLDGNVPTNRWLQFSDSALPPLSTAYKSEIISAKEHSKGSAKQHSKVPVMSANQHSKPPVSMGAKQHSPSINSYQGSDSIKDSIGAAGAGRVVALPVAGRR